uniref:Transthyretin-like family protein n=1 Tax=Plectus sambesii TaxID=2011161 RepID=A0A914X9Z7_9BILA
MCDDKPLNNTRVKLWDDDSGPDPDEELASTRTDAQGRFELQGSTKEISNIDIRFKIYHDCDDILLCQRRVKFAIPSKYINNEEKVSKWFDAGILNMALEYKGEERDCSLDSLDD